MDGGSLKTTNSSLQNNDNNNKSNYKDILSVIYPYIYKKIKKIK